MNERSIFGDDPDMPTDREQLEKTIDGMRDWSCDGSDIDFVELLFSKYKEQQQELEDANNLIAQLRAGA